MENKHPSSSSNEKQVISQQSDLTDVLIFEEILTRLPVKTILRFKSVSKQWYSTLSSTDFANTHLKKSPFSHPSAPVNTLFIQSFQACSLFSYDHEVNQISEKKVDLNPEFWVDHDQRYLVGSCNGLICITARGGGIYFILWNPATGKVNKYAPPDDVYLDRFKKIAEHSRTYGFGYVSSVDDYKFVAILKQYEGDNESLFPLIFSMRENKWRKIDLNHILRFLSDSGVLVGEKLYWRSITDRVHKLVSFDLAGERFDVIEVNWDGCEGLGVLKGCLCSLNCSNNKVDIMEPPAIAESIELPKGGLHFDEFSQMIGFTKTDNFFVTGWSANTIISGVFYGRRMIGVVDTSTRHPQYAHLFNMGEVMFNIARYVPSLVSPFPTEDS